MICCWCSDIHVLVVGVAIYMICSSCWRSDIHDVNVIAQGETSGSCIRTYDCSPDWHGSRITDHVQMDALLKSPTTSFDCLPKCMLVVSLIQEMQ